MFYICSMKYLKTKLCLLSVLMTFIVMPKNTKAQKVELGHSFKGITSFYSVKFYGNKTASGERLQKGIFSAAHKTLPFGTMLEVEDKKTGKWVIVRVNDRGPFTKNRVLDLSIDAAEQLGIVNQGLAQVSIKVIGFDGAVELIREDAFQGNFNQILAQNTPKVKIPYRLED